MRKRRVLKFLPRPVAKLKVTAIQKATAELEAAAKKNNFLLRRSEYLHQQALMHNLLSQELKSDIAVEFGKLSALADRVEKLLTPTIRIRRKN